MTYLSCLAVVLWSSYLLTIVAGAGHTSSGASGDVCGPRNQRCIEGEASCDSLTGKCKCHDPPFHYGNGYIKCYKKNSFRTEVTNDPDVRTFNDISVPLPLPCRYLLTHTVTFLKRRRNDIRGTCEFNTHSFHQKARGKFYIAGYDVAIKIKYNNGTEKKMSIRVWGTANHGTHYFNVNATDNQYLPNGPWQNDQIDYYDHSTRLRVKVQYDNDNNLALLDAKKCGIAFQFRPYDQGLRKNQPQIPHLAVAVNCAYHPDFKSRDHVAAMVPVKSHGGFTIDEVLIPGLNREQTLMVRALKSGAVQNSPYPNPQCSVAALKLDACDPSWLARSVKTCEFIVTLPRFIKCYDSSMSGEGIMELFNDCLDVFCHSNGYPGDCNAVINKITAKGCEALYPPYYEVLDFVSGSECP